VSRVWSTILLAAAGTYAMRASFLVFARRMATVPPLAQRLLRQIPPAALASLAVPALLRPAGHIDVTQARLYAGIVAAVVAWRTKSTTVTLIVGMAVLLALQALG